MCTHNTQSPLLNDLAPGVRGVDKVPQVVIGNNDPVCFFCKVEQEPYVERERASLDTRLSLSSNVRCMVHRGESTSRGTLCLLSQDDRAATVIFKKL